MLARLVAELLWVASLEIQRPEFHRWELARRDLLRAMREPPPATKLKENNAE